MEFDSKVGYGGLKVKLDAPEGDYKICLGSCETLRPARKYRK